MHSSTDFPDFHALLRQHARDTPCSVAVVDGPREITYERFLDDLDKVARRLNALHMEPGSRALLFFHSAYLHWLSVIALWRLGVISVSVADLSRPGLFDLLDANALLTDRTDLKTEGGGVIVVPQEWLQASADLLPEIVPRGFDAQQPVRILLSSGTTGTSKKILLDNARIGARIEHLIDCYNIRPHHRFMSVVGQDTVGGFVYPVLTWAAGGSVAFYDAAMPFDKLLVQTRVNLIFMSPVQAANLVDTLPEDFRQPPIALIVAGGRLPQLVAERAREKLASTIWLVYGSTEAGTVTLDSAPDYARPDVVGTIVPTAQVQIVDGAGQPLAPGATGEVRVRGASCVQSYVDDPETSRVFFRDGWFYPGDLGTLSADNVLSIVGRVGDVMNLGGVKLAPGAIEDALRACPGVKDLAAFSVPDDAGVESLWVALVAGEGYSEDALRQRFKSHFPTLVAPDLALLDAIPRNGMAKVQRNELRRMVHDRLTRGAVAASGIGYFPTPDGAGAHEQNQANQHMETAMAKVKINDQEYEFETLPDNVKAQLASIRFVETELQRLEMQKAALQTARVAYLRAVGEAMKEV